MVWGRQFWLWRVNQRGFEEPDGTEIFSRQYQSQNLNLNFVLIYAYNFTVVTRKKILNRLALNFNQNSKPFSQHSRLFLIPYFGSSPTCSPQPPTPNRFWPCQSVPNTITNLPRPSNGSLVPIVTNAPPTMSPRNVWVVHMFSLWSRMISVEKVASVAFAAIPWPKAIVPIPATSAAVLNMSKARPRPVLLATLIATLPMTLIGWKAWMLLMWMSPGWTTMLRIVSCLIANGLNPSGLDWFNLPLSHPPTKF